MCLLRSKPTELKSIYFNARYMTVPESMNSELGYLRSDLTSTMNSLDSTRKAIVFTYYLQAVRSSPLPHMGTHYNKE